MIPLDGAPPPRTTIRDVPLHCLHHSLLVVALAVAPHASAGVIVVAASGGGAFTDLPAAVSAAADGDVLLIQSGTYSAFSITNKSLDLVADAGASVIVNGASSIAQLAVTRSATLTGLVLHGPPGMGTNVQPALRLFNDAGSVRVQGCEIRGHDGAPCTDDAYGGGALFAIQCGDVSIARCTLIAGDAGDLAPSGYSGGYGGDTLGGNASRIAVFDSTVRAGRGASDNAACGSGGSLGYPGSGGDAGVFFDCPAGFISRSSFQGGDGGATGAGEMPPGRGLLLVGGAPLSTLESTFASGFYAGGGTLPAVWTFSGAAHVSLAGSARTLTTNRVVREGANLRIELHGQPGDVVELAFADRGRFATSSAWVGVDLLRTEKPRPLMQAGVIDPTGALHLTWPIEELGPGVQARRLFLQAAFRDASGVTTLSTPATVVLLDSAY